MCIRCWDVEDRRSDRPLFGIVEHAVPVREGVAEIDPPALASRRCGYRLLEIAAVRLVPESDDVSVKTFPYGKRTSCAAAIRLSDHAMALPVLLDAAKETADPQRL